MSDETCETDHDATVNEDGKVVDSNGVEEKVAKERARYEAWRKKRGKSTTLEDN